MKPWQQVIAIEEIDEWLIRLLIQFFLIFYHQNSRLSFQNESRIAEFCAEWIYALEHWNTEYGIRKGEIFHRILKRA